MVPSIHNAPLRREAKVGRSDCATFSVSRPCRIEYNFWLMKHWAVSVAALYCFVLFTLTVPVIAPACGLNIKDAFGVYGDWGYWLWLLVMAVAQVALLAVPVRIASRRPVSRRPLLTTIMASGLMMGGLVAGAVCAVDEFARFDVGTNRHAWLVLGIMGLSWCLWSLIFFRMARKEDAPGFVSRQSRTLFKGSVLELLVAVPTHIAVRHRHECCAGIMTFFGLSMGISVMLFAFGPAVFFLFVARWRRLHPEVSESS
jgi:hypothetical protein